MENKNYTIALLIDTENVSSKYISALMKELFVLGKVTYRRMYGDFTKSSAEGWKKMVNKFAISPVQQYTYTVGKNATDSKMIIDAMDILYSGDVDAFCIMSSDSDFTGIAKRLKESNNFVIGAGEKKTPNSFVNCCDRFFILEEISGKSTKKSTVTSSKTPSNCQSKKKPVKSNANIKDNKKDIKEVKEKENNHNNCDDDGIEIIKDDIEDFAIKILEDYTKPIELALLIQKIYQAYPQFNFKNFGYKKPIDFFDTNKFAFSKGKTTEKFITLK